MKALLMFAISMIVDPLVEVFRAAMRFATLRTYALPRLISFAQHPFQKRGYGKTVAGGSGFARIMGALLSPRMAVAVVLVVAVVAAVHAQTGPPDLTMLAMSFAGTTLVEKREALAAKQNEMKEIMELAKDGRNFDLSRKSVLERLGAVDAADALGKIRAKNRELEAMGTELQQAELKEIEAGTAQIGEWIDTPKDSTQPGGSLLETKSFGERYISMKEFRDSRRSRVSIPALVDVSIKTLFQTSAGFAPESLRTGRIVEGATRPIQVLDLIPSAPINSPVEKYMEQTTRTHAAAERAEGASYAESTFVYTEKTSDVRSVG